MNGIRIFILSSLIAILWAQQRTCLTDVYNAMLEERYPQIRRIRQQLPYLLRTYIEQQKTQQTGVITIPVVVHIVWNSPAESLSVAQVQSQIAVLNEDFRKLNADTTNILSVFKPLAADLEIEFCLAQVDPQGNPTNGITYTYTTVTSFSGDEVKSSSTGGKDPWPTDRYLNIWVCNLSGALGYAQFPWSYSASPNTDGVVINYQAFGRGGSAQPPYDLGRTTTHEIGHWLGLYHNFQDGCEGMTSTTCAYEGDLICDTPPASGPNYGCPATPPNTCSESPNLPDMYQNFMDYSDDACLLLFTQDQKAVTRAMLQLFRPQFYNHIIGNLCTGTPQPPIALFEMSKQVICPGQSVQFIDKSYNQPTQWQWNFQGGTPSTFNGQNPPAITFNTPGIYTIQLTASNAQGSNTFTKTLVVGASDTLNEKFNQGIRQDLWTIQNPDNDVTWELATVNGSANHSRFAALMEFYYYNAPGQRDGLISYPVYIPSSASSASLLFDWAYAQYQNYNDSLIVYISNDCGATWQRVWAKGGSSLATAPSTLFSFEPTSASEWCSPCASIDLSAFIGDTILVKFEGYSDYGNNLYLDNIRIDIVTPTLQSDPIQKPWVKVFPNPIENTFRIWGLELSDYPITIAIYDPIGKLVHQSGVYTPEELINIEELPAGYYTVKVLTSKHERFMFKIIKRQ